MKYTLLVEDMHSDFAVKMTFDAVTIQDVMSNVELFLRGAGFHPDCVREQLINE